MPYGSGKEEEQSRKLFVGGLSRETSDDGLKSYFDKYGNIVDCVVICDQETKRSKGFGFVTYETETEADSCMNDRPHNLHGKTIDVKRAVSREESSKPGAHVQVKKIFIGGVVNGCDEQMLEDYFKQFGSIVSCVIPTDRNTGDKKNFGFITFDDFDVVDKLVAKRYHQIAGNHSCEVKKALSKDEMERAKQTVGGRHDHYEERGGGGRERSWGRGGGSGGGRSGGGRSGGSRSGGRYQGGGYGDYGNDGYGTYGNGGGYGGYGSGYSNDNSNYGPVRGSGQYSQKSSGPYGGGYGSSSGGGGGGGGGYGGNSYNDGYGGYGNSSGGGSGSYGRGSNNSNSGYGSGNANNSGYGGYGNQSNYGGQGSYGNSGGGY